ncbi:MAG: hypothetical protein HUU03_08115 [Planctomycetaceae bacterium]|nr:hypothetical protein [Planctomycetota bacterium]MCQ3951499.1 hypothetical protein [Planctomycetota bacterium]NUO16392.1 hypothetical protein [Planctomycetaceae bacterium]GIK53643.1 MAG: hypothetical protein BroJett014_26160 [Planctomycetota bacterium]HRJ78595.1 hypothetical protein [Planctomycetota bacterium]
MRLWLIAALLCCTPVLAQGDLGAATPPPADKPSEKPQDKDKQEEDRGPLTFSRDRVGWGISARAGVGFDTNIFKEDRNEDSGWFADGRAAAFFGVNIADIIALGVEGRASGRLYFGQDDAEDANIFDLWLAAFLKHPVDKPGFGGGIRVEALYDQQQNYEIVGPLTRQDDLRRGDFRARSWFGWMPAGVLYLEWGLSARLTDYSEEENPEAGDVLGVNSLGSKDSWEFGIDFSPELRFWQFFTVGPYIMFQYEWFREQFDLHPDTFSANGDKLQLLRFEYGAKARLRFWGFHQSYAKIYARRQDDSAQGFNRYWQYGLMVQTEFKFAIVRIGGGFDVWTREFDERADPDVLGASRESVFERYLGINVELGVNFVWTLEVGARYDFQRRTSDLNNEGYLAHQVSLFVGFDW